MSAPRNAVRARLEQVKPAWIVIAAWAIAIAYAYPGYLSLDAADHLYRSRIPQLDDLHPPVMSWYWHQIERLVRGPFPLLVLQTSLAFWGLYTLLARHASARAAAITTAVVLLFPPILSSIAHVGPDAQMAGFFLGGLALALRPRWRWRALGVVLLFVAVAVRENGAAALFPFCTVVVGAWGLRKRALVVLATFGMCGVLLVSAVLVNSGLRDTRKYPWFRELAIVDIAGTICVAGGSDEQIEQLLRGIPLTETPGRSLHQKLCETFEPRPWSQMLFPDDRAVFDPTPERTDRLSRKRAWVWLVKRHTDAFVAHRWAIMKELLGLGAEPRETVTQTFTHAVADPAITGTALDPGPLRHRAPLSWFQKQLGGWFQWLAETPIYRPWIYALLALLVLVVAVIRRSEIVAAIAVSGLLYEATFFAVAPVPMFRYSLWMIASACIAAAWLIAERSRRQSPA